MTFCYMEMFESRQDNFLKVSAHQPQALLILEDWKPPKSNLKFYAFMLYALLRLWKNHKQHSAALCWICGNTTFCIHTWATYIFYKLKTSQL